MSSADSDSDIDHVGVKIAGDVQTDTVCDDSDSDVDYCGFASIGRNATSALLPPVLEQLVHLSDKIGRSSKKRKRQYSAPSKRSEWEHAALCAVMRLAKKNRAAERATSSILSHYEKFANQQLMLRSSTINQKLLAHSIKWKGGKFITSCRGKSIAKLTSSAVVAISNPSGDRCFSQKQTAAIYGVSVRSVKRSRESHALVLSISSLPTYPNRPTYFMCS